MRSSHPEIDFIVRREFDYAVVEYANGKPLAGILGASFRGPDGKSGAQCGPSRDREPGRAAARGGCV
jgi:hypothetical protein